jgi:16S rRNA (cytidine1402-2'-O)-methyltransferase
VTCLGPERRVVVTRELTKHFEEVQRGTASVLLDVFQERTVRGECTVLIAGRPA